ncbi:IMP dehydrogenase [Aureococcus anophagefferens]|nr:IMP dehydrogenase [Aureococcus anophagefferens]
MLRLGARPALAAVAGFACYGDRPRCLRIEEDVKLDFKDVLIRPKRSTLRSRSEVTLERELKFKHSGRSLACVPVVVANMDTVGTFDMCVALARHGCLVAVHKHAVEVTGRRRRATSGGAGRATLIAGNVVTNEMTEELILNGADVVKVGIGPGSVCTTRKQTGVGYPQVSAIVECADAAHGLGGHIVADGGVTCPGDAAKAFGAGADLIMMGGLFSGTDGRPAVLVKPDGRASLFAASPASPCTSTRAASPSTGPPRARPSRSRQGARGRHARPPGGIRSTCTYVGAATLRSPKRTTFVRVSQQLTVFGTRPSKK